MQVSMHALHITEKVLKDMAKFKLISLTSKSIMSSTNLSQYCTWLFGIDPGDDTYNNPVEKIYGIINNHSMYLIIYVQF